MKDFVMDLRVSMKLLSLSLHETLTLHDYFFRAATQIQESAHDSSCPYPLVGSRRLQIFVILACCSSSAWKKAAVRTMVLVMVEKVVGRGCAWLVIQ